MAEPPNIAYLVPQFPGQTHIFFWREIKALEAMGTGVHLFSTTLPPPGLISHDWSDEAIGRTEYLGRADPLAALRGLAAVPFWRWRNDLGRGGRALWRDLLICAPAAARLARACRRRGITHIHAHSCGRAALIAALAAEMTGLPYSLTLHGPLCDYGPGQGLKWRGAAFGLVITRKILGEIRAEIGPDLPRRVPIQPMGVDTEALRRKTPYQPARKDEVIRVFACGRLNIVKGHQDLMQAVSLLAERGLKVELDIAGEDDDGGNGYRRELEALLEAKGLTGRVRLLGAISSDQVRDRLHAAHIFVLASWHEPLGVAYMEAMASGVPTIGTDAGGVPELITHGETGWLVAPKSPEALADAIQTIAADPALATRLGEAGQRLIEARFHSAIGAETLLSEMAKAGAMPARHGITTSAKASRQT
ncbi:MAG: glycosyltransferase family 4 protein [Rhodobacteraceae bacterium]|nr:glycosyltransferase family 4 protein [Paracoccaceae bacterium]